MNARILPASLLFFLFLIVGIPCVAQPMNKKENPLPRAEGWSINVMTEAPISYGHRWFTIDAFNRELHVLYFHSTKEYTPNWLIYGYSPDDGLSWKFDTIDGRADTMSHAKKPFSIAVFNGAIAVDCCGVPHVFYTINYFYDGRHDPSWAVHAQKVDGKWIRDTIDARSAGESMINFDVDMVIGADNEPRVVYIRGENEPMFGRRSGGTWKIEPIGGIGGPRYIWNSLALDSRDRPHVLLGKFPGLEYAVKSDGEKSDGEKSDGEWHVAPAFSGSDINGIGDIVMDDKDQPHITMNRSSGKPFYHAVRTGGKWENSQIESSSDGGSANGNRARIKRDPEGNLHAAYYGHNDLPSSEYIVYASSTDNGKSWKEEVVEYVGSIYVESSYPDLVITDSMIGIFYKGEGDTPRFACRTQVKPEFRRSKPNNCGQKNTRQHPFPGTGKNKT